MVGSAGSFAAIATLLGSPLPAAFLLMEVAGLGGAILDIALLPGLTRHQYHHAIDIVPTILDTLGVEPPARIKGHVQSRFEGVSMRYSAQMESAPSARKTQFYSMLGSRGIWHDGWKAVTNHPTLAGVE